MWMLAHGGAAGQRKRATLWCSCRVRSACVCVGGPPGALPCHGGPQNDPGWPQRGPYPLSWGPLKGVKWGAHGWVGWGAVQTEVCVWGGQ